MHKQKHVNLWRVEGAPEREAGKNVFEARGIKWMHPRERPAFNVER